MLAAAGAAQVLGPDHGVTKALAKVAITMDKADLWQARLAIKTLRRDQREAIAEAGESGGPSKPPTAPSTRAGYPAARRAPRCTAQRTASWCRQGGRRAEIPRF